MDWLNLWHTALHWVSLHPELAYVGVFLVALSESLAMVGLLVPGTVMMIGIGAIVGGGVLSLKITLAVAMAGAVAGDGVSYWLGRHYHQGLKALWPFRKYPQLLVRGEEFFRRHGGKSVLLGRFVGPVRPVVPVIAGMLDMPAGRFVLVNVLSAAGWAFAYLIPGVLLGGSLTVISAVSTRLSLLLLLLLVLLWLAFWLCRQIFVWLGKLGPKGEQLLLPVLCLALFLAGWLFLGVLEDLVNLDPLVRADQAIYQFLQTLRTPWGDHTLVAVTELGDGPVTLLIAAVVFSVLLLQRKLRAAGYWLIAVSGGMGLVELFKWALHRPRPIAIYEGVSSWGFPSGHSTMSVVLYGFLAILAVRGFNSRWRWLPFAMAIGLSLLIAFSRIYLGAHWLSDVLGGLSLGWAWVTFLGIFYLRRSKDESPKGILLLSVTLALLLFGGWHIHSRHALDLARYQVRLPVQTLSARSWLHSDWQQLPVFRVDLAGETEQPLTVQWAGDPETLAKRLTGKGWVQVAGDDFRKWLNLFVSNVGIDKLPVLPQLENGQQERLLMVLNQGAQRLVLRLWPTSFRLEEADQLLWVGTLESERPVSLADLLTIPRGLADYSEALQALTRALPQRVLGQVVRRSEPQAEGVSGWDGRVLLAADDRKAPGETKE